MCLPRVVLRRYQYFYLFWLVLLNLLYFSCNHVVAAPKAEEHKVKAVFFLNLGSFVIFPDDVLKESESFNLCVLGDDPFQGVLDFAAKNKTIKSHKLTVEYYQDVNDVSGCHALYISESKAAELKEIFVVLGQKPILTASDIKDFVLHGGMVKFYTNKRKIRLAVSPRHFNKVGLKASAHLMRVATVVEADKIE